MSDAGRKESGKTEGGEGFIYFVGAGAGNDSESESGGRKIFDQILTAKDGGDPKYSVVGPTLCLVDFVYLAVREFQVVFLGQEIDPLDAADSLVEADLEGSDLKVKEVPEGGLPGEDVILN